MTNPMFNPQPNYSGVTIQISNPAVNLGGAGVNGGVNGGINSGVNRGVNNGVNNPLNCYPSCIANNCYAQYPYYYPAQIQAVEQPQVQGLEPQIQTGTVVTNPIAQPHAQTQNQLPNTYPVQYYLNNYNYGGDNKGVNISGENGSYATGQLSSPEEVNKNSETDNDSYNAGQQNDISGAGTNIIQEPSANMPQSAYQNEQAGSEYKNAYRKFGEVQPKKEQDFTKSNSIINELDERETAMLEEKKNTKETKIVALTDEYIKSLENYLNNPNDEIRLMASKEILTRLDEDKDRYDDAALNALLNKMLQDPSKLIRVAALSAFASQLASGNDYTVQLLHNIQSNPNADKEDVLQAADILLKMSAGTEIKNIPDPKTKENQQ